MRRLKKRLFRLQRRHRDNEEGDDAAKDNDTVKDNDADAPVPFRTRSYSSALEYVGSLHERDDRDARATKDDNQDDVERRTRSQTRSCATLRGESPITNSSSHANRLRVFKRRIANWFRRPASQRENVDEAEENVYSTVVAQPALEAIRRRSASPETAQESPNPPVIRPDLIGLTPEERMCRIPLPGRMGTQPDWVHKEGLRWFEAPLSLTPITVTTKEFRDPERKKKIHDPLGYRELVKRGWYWGPVTRHEAEKLLAGKPPNTFLVRDTSDYCHLYAISVVTGSGSTRHMLIEHNGWDSWSLYKDDAQGKRTVVDLIESYMEEARCGTSTIRSSEGVIFLLTPLSRFARLRSLQDQCRFVIRMYTRFDLVKELPLPLRIKEYLLLDPL